MLTFTLIIVAELCLLFRLALPDFLAFAEERFNEVYSPDPFQHPFGDVPDLNELSHFGAHTTEGEGFHA